MIRIRRTLGLAALATLVAGVASTAAATPAPAPAQVPATPGRVELAVPPASKRVYMVSDSVGLGTRTTMATYFPPDWQVTVDGTPALFVEQLESKHVRYRMATAPWVFGDTAIVAGGYNYPYWDPARFDRSVDSMIATLEQAGAKHIYWVTLREVKPQYITASAWKQVQPYYWYFPTVNQHLRAALTRHHDLSLIDWASIADRPGLTYDAIHLNPTGAAAYSSKAARTVLTTPSDRPAGSVTEVQVRGVAGIPADAAAVALTITATTPRTTGYVTAFPCGAGVPVVSTLNMAPDQTVAATTVVSPGAGGKVCLFTSTDANIVVDVTGWFPAGAGFVAVPPKRLADTRQPAGSAPRPAGSVTRVHVAGANGVPAGAAGVVLNVTATAGSVTGYVTVAPCGGAPVASLTFEAGRTSALTTIVEPGTNGDVCLVPSQAVHLVADVFGAFAASADAHPHSIVRLADTRGQGQVPGGTARAVHALGSAVPAGAHGVLVNVTAANPAGVGYLTVYPCGSGVPPTSTLNVVPNHPAGNLAIVRPDAAGNVCTFTSTSSDVVIDVAGYLGAAFEGMSPTRLYDSRHP